MKISTNVINGGTFPTGISIKIPPAKTEYKSGEALKTDGIVVIATFSNKTTKNITNECVMTPANGANLTENNKEINIEWKWKNLITYSAKQNINVQRVLQGISVLTLPAKTSYNKNEALNTSGLTVTATFTSGNMENVTARCTSVPANGEILSTLGSKNVVVSYSENGITKTSNFNISVNVKTVTWAGGTDQEIADMVTAADVGIINLATYWSVGDERTINLSAMPSTGVGETHSAQPVTLTLMNSGGKTLANGKQCNFIVGQKNALLENGYMNSSGLNSGGWDSSQRRTWCNSVYKDSISSALRSIFKQFKNMSGLGGGSSSGVQESIDYFALPAEIEVFGSLTYSVSGEGQQFEYYKITANRIKKNGDSGSAYPWWERSPQSGDSYSFCGVYSGGSASAYSASITYALAPFGCI